MSSVLVVGPRELPESGTVTVWVDAGSTSGQTIAVRVRDLRLAEADDGGGDTALYSLRAYDCQG